MIWFAVCSTIACSPENANQGAGEPAPQLNATSHETLVRTYLLKPMVFEFSIQSIGKIQAENEIKFTSSTSGLVEAALLHNNDIVISGKPLIKLNTEILELKIKKTKENIFSSKLNYESDILSQESLLKNKTKGVRDTVYRKLRANVGLTSAELELKDLQLELSKQVIKAPISGRLASVKIRKGMYIREGDELFTIYTHNQLFLEGKILETEIGSVKIGQAARVTPVAHTKSFKAVVAEMNPLVDENGLVTLKIRLIDPGSLMPGMNATSEIVVPQKTGLFVPKQAVVRRNGRSVVFTLENNEAIWNYVVVGLDNGKELEILKGLKQGQKIIITNNLQLAHHAVVKEEY